MRKLLLLAFFISLAGCAARSKVRLSDPGAEKLAAHAGPVCMLRSPLPTNVKYKTLAALNSSKRTYGSVSELIPLMAADARAVGANAIINLNTGQRMGAFAWARPVGTGTAVKIEDSEAFNCVGAGGELR
ncbi:hypothetical protein IP92_04339 [Pseudoduganella flava]|uniref:Uncharacterized protein n=1 Tax=Pseudoduganella flava TaxID=871742 RepID=A0A562PIY7_9BURK|nr:hypothetical protein [Pseudoduganella flava]QGZ41975.1 hypothetical protein GO485_24940 [Pseudoduganella flava]TWI44389.1 hypothetical protein IP92_04339 [Pseudoduganella flava]